MMMTYRFRKGMLVAGLTACCGMSAQAADYLTQAQQMLAKGDLRGAQIQLRNAVRSNPSSGAAHFQLALTDLKLGDAVAAEKEARAAREAGYDAAAAISLLGQSYLAEGRASDLLKELTVGPKDDPAVAASILVVRGLALLAQDDPDQAQIALAEAERLAPQSPGPLLAQEQLALRRKDFAAAAQKLDRVLVLDPRSEEALLRKGSLAERQGDQVGALAAYDAAVATAPGAYAARLARAGILIAKGQFANAKADVDATLAAVPNNGTGILMRAVLLLQAGDYKAADAQLEMISTALGRFQQGYLYRALVKQRLGQMEQAADAAGRYAARNPADVNGAKLLAEIQLQMKQPARAIETLSRLASADTHDWGLYELLGRAYELAGNAGLAARSLQKAVTLAPDNAALRNRLAAIRIQIGDASGALRDLEHSLQLVPVQPEAEQMLVQVALANGDIAAATGELDKLRQQVGDTPAVGTIAGLIRFAQLDLDGARSRFEAVLKDHPDWIPAKLALARVDAMQGQTEMSRKLLGEVLAQHPDNTAALPNVISGLLAEGKTAQAVQAAEQAHHAAPDNLALALGLTKLYVQTGAADKAAALIGEIRQDQLPNLSLLALRAEVQEALGHKADAQDLYRQILELSPSDLPVRMKLAGLLIEAKDYDGARPILEEGLGNQPGNYQLLSGLVLVALRAGGLQAGLAKAEALQKVSGNLPAAARLTGDIYMSEKRFGDAASAYSAAMKLAPSSALALHLGQALLAAGQPDKARGALQEWLARYPDDSGAAEVLAGWEIAANQLEDAKAHLKAVLDRRPNDAAALNNLAWIYQKQSNSSQARSLAEHAFLLAPTPQIADTLGWILTEQGDARVGVLLLRDAVSHMPNDPTLRYHLAVALKQTGQHDEAIKLLNQLTAGPENFPDKPEARRVLDELSGNK
jgi:putative PEP-CTERM system TPR-repeat lipoprotein